MPKVIPVPDELGKPFWDAVNEKRLVLQNCTHATCSSIRRGRPVPHAAPPRIWNGKR